MYAEAFLTRTYAQAPACSVNGSSGVAVGEHWIATAAHTWGTTFPTTADGVALTVERTETIPSIDLGGGLFTSDLMLIKVTERLTAWSRVKTTKPADGADLLTGGFGLSNTNGAIPFNFPSQAGYAGLKYGSGKFRSSEYSTGTASAAGDAINAYWVWHPSEGGTTCGSIARNDSGSPIWEVCGGENVLVAIANGTGTGAAITNPPIVYDYCTPYPVPAGGDIGTKYCSGIRLATQDTTYFPPGFASIDAWLRSLMYEDYFPEFRSAFFDTAFFTNDFYRTDALSGAVSADASSRQRRVTRGRWNRIRDRLRS